MSRSPLEAHRETFTRNLLAVYANAPQAARVDGARWYPDARRIVREWSETYALPLATVACVTAAISPQCEWSRNLIIADDVLASRAVSVGGALPVNVTKARAILQDAPTSTLAMLRYFPSGPKVNSFAANLAGDDVLVTVDTHALQAAFGDVTVTRTLKWPAYTVLAECYASAALRVGLAGPTFQAIVWHAWKLAHPRVSKLQARRRW